MQQTVAYLLTGIAHGPIQIVPASVPAASYAAPMPVCSLASLGALRCLCPKSLSCTQQVELTDCGHSRMP